MKVDKRDADTVTLASFWMRAGTRPGIGASFSPSLVAHPEFGRVFVANARLLLGELENEIEANTAAGKGLEG